MMKIPPCSLSCADTNLPGRYLLDQSASVINSFSVGSAVIKYLLRSFFVLLDLGITLQAGQAAGCLQSEYAAGQQHPQLKAKTDPSCVKIIIETLVQPLENNFKYISCFGIACKSCLPGGTQNYFAHNLLNFQSKKSKPRGIAVISFMCICTPSSFFRLVLMVRNEKCSDYRANTSDCLCPGWSALRPPGQIEHSYKYRYRKWGNQPQLGINREADLDLVGQHTHLLGFQNHPSLPISITRVQRGAA